MPKLVVVPKNKNDILQIINFARKNKLSITARAGGTNTCGSALGEGIIIDFSKMNSIIWKKNKSTKVQPGVIYADLNKELAKTGQWIAFNPSSNDSCMIGGNLATKASGLSSVKYKSMDSFVKSVEFIDAKGRLIDTAKGIPKDLGKKILELKKKILKDKKTVSKLKKRMHLKTSSGYNIFAFLKYKKPSEIVTHLMSGSVGTLGLFTEIELNTLNKPKKTVTFISDFESLNDAGKAVQKIVKLNPSTLEILDEFSLKLLKEKLEEKMNEKIKASLLIQFDTKISENKIKKLLEKNNAKNIFFETNEKKQLKILKMRETIFHQTTKIDDGRTPISFIEDMAVPIEHLSTFILDLQKIFQKNKIEAIIYGHAGEGNLHIRPLINVNKKNWKSTVKKIAKEAFGSCFKYGGTITGEHASGLNKAPFLEKEWGKKIYAYFKEIKNIFDQENILNTKAMFFKGDFTKNMKY